MKKQPALTRQAARRAPARQIPDAPARKRVGGSYFRVLPLTMMMCVLLLGVKMNELYSDGTKLHQMFSVSDANAQGAETKEAQSAEVAPEKTAPESAENAQSNKAADDKKDSKDPSKVELASLEKEPETQTGEKEHHYSQIELDILQSLSARRKEIEERAQELDMKEKLLDATEVRVNDKLEDIKSLKAEVEKLLAAYNEQEDAKLAGLVKIYETMKPKDAAKIFNELEMEIMLEVTDRMAERRVAPILAAMDPMKAKDLTTELAEYRRLRTLPKTLGSN